MTGTNNYNVSEEETAEKLRDNILNGDHDESLNICAKAVKAGVDPLLLINKGITLGLNLVGEKFQKGEYFLSELILTGEIVKECIKILEPYLKAHEIRTRGKIVLGTVEGDLHDIGKNLFGILMKSTGFEVIDLGVDVSPERFIQSIKKYSPRILGMSALLSTTLPKMATTIRKLEEEGLRNKVKVIIGGAPVDSEYAKKIRSDASTRDAFEGVEVCTRWVDSD